MNRDLAAVESADRAAFDSLYADLRSLARAPKGCVPAIASASSPARAAGNRTEDAT
jgi:hypothetical protein